MTEPPSFSGRVALVTGASSGIGAAIAERLAAAGAAVALGYATGEAPARALAERIEAAGGRAVALGADLRSAEAAVGIVDDAVGALGPLDLLVPNAGLGRVQTLDEVSVADFDETLAVNLRAPFLMAQRALPAMAERGYGRVLFMSSVAGLTGGVVGPHYAASKAGLHGLTHFLAVRFAGAGVTVNALAPALIEDTQMLPGSSEEMLRRVPVGRLGTTAEVADLALAVMANGYVTSQVISVDGGIYPH